MCGDYCGECGELLVDAITHAIQMPERYEKAFRNTDGRIRRELELIREQRERRGQ
nr:MAG TPA: antitoxin [Caudoviricetes sp.]